MNRKRHQEDQFHLNRKKTNTLLESGLSEGAAICFECLSCPYRNWTATLWWTVHVGVGGGVRVELQMCGWRTWYRESLPLQRISDVSDTRWLVGGGPGTEPVSWILILSSFSLAKLPLNRLVGQWVVMMIAFTQLLGDRAQWQGIYSFWNERINYLLFPFQKSGHSQVSSKKHKATSNWELTKHRVFCVFYHYLIFAFTPAVLLCRFSALQMWKLSFKKSRKLSKLGKLNHNSDFDHIP